MANAVAPRIQIDGHFLKLLGMEIPLEKVSFSEDSDRRCVSFHICDTRKTPQGYEEDFLTTIRLLFEGNVEEQQALIRQCLDDTNMKAHLGFRIWRIYMEPQQIHFLFSAVVHKEKFQKYAIPILKKMGEFGFYEGVQETHLGQAHSVTLRSPKTFDAEQIVTIFGELTNRFGPSLISHPRDLEDFDVIVFQERKERVAYWDFTLTHSRIYTLSKNGKVYTNIPNGFEVTQEEVRSWLNDPIAQSKTTDQTLRQRLGELSLASTRERDGTKLRILSRQVDELSTALSGLALEGKPIAEEKKIKNL